MRRNISLETARAVVADPRNGEDYQRECAAILAAAGETAAATPLARPEVHVRPDADECIRLGIDSAGKPMTAAACRAERRDPVDYLSAAGAQLTAAGKSVLDTLRKLPRERAKALGIDVVATEAYARAHGIDPTECLQAAIQTAEQFEADRLLMDGAPVRPANEKPRDEQLETDRAVLHRLGTDF